MAEQDINPSVAGKEIAALLTNDFLEAARYLRMVQQEHRELFRQVAANAGVKLRRAYYLAEIDRRFGGSDIPKDRLRAIGWTKLKIICSKIGNEKWGGLSQVAREEYLSFAESRTAHELELLIDGQDPSFGARAVVLRLSPEQLQLFEKIILSHGGVKIGKALVNKEPALTKALSRLDVSQTTG